MYYFGMVLQLVNENVLIKDGLITPNKILMLLSIELWLVGKLEPFEREKTISQDEKLQIPLKY